MRALVESAQAPVWKYVYTAALLTWIALVNHLVLFLSILSTRHFLREIRASESLTQKAGLLTLLLIVAVVLANLALFAVGLLHNPGVWATLILGKHFGVVTVAAMIIGSNVLAWFLSDPWLSAVVVAPLLPILALMLLTIPALYYDAKKRLVRDTTELALMSFMSWIGSRGIALLITLLAVAAILASLELLPLPTGQ